jgi:hypothetical protein
MDTVEIPLTDSLNFPAEKIKQFNILAHYEAFIARTNQWRGPLWQAAMDLAPSRDPFRSGCERWLWAMAPISPFVVSCGWWVKAAEARVWAS